MADSSEDKKSVASIATVVAAVIGACAVVAAATIGICPALVDLIPNNPTPSVLPSAIPVATDTAMPLSPTSVPALIETPSDATFSSPVQLSIRDLWATGTECQQGDAWSADIWVQPEGGDGNYEYYVDGVWKTGPIAEGVTIHVSSNDCTAIDGTLTVESAGQIASGEFHVPVPDCCQ